MGGELTMDNIRHPIYERQKTEGSFTSLREAKEAREIGRAHV